MRIGVLGGGQLGRMLALAGYQLGFEFRFLDPAEDACAGQVAEHLRADYADPDALNRFLRGLDVVTYEFENVPVDTVEWLGERISVFPPVNALRISQDRLHEKELFRLLSIPTAEFRLIDSGASLEEAFQQIGERALLKTRRMGYDGKGQFTISEVGDLRAAWDTVQGVPCLLEKQILFRKELSIIGVRGRDGETRFYPLVQNKHEEGILRISIAPAPGIDAKTQTAVEDYCRRVMEHLNYVGVLAIELFETDDGLLANEMAPRVHNSGHWTIEGTETSQFENHLRAITGLPLGSTAVRGAFEMTNIIGELPSLSEVLARHGAHVHLYGKIPKAGRKLGHVTSQLTS